MLNLSRSYLAFAAAVSLALSPQSASAEGHNSQATLGSTGTEIAVVECPAGEVLRGFSGRSGAAIDQLQVLCAPLLADGGYGDAHPIREAYGGFGGGPFPATTCDRNSRIAGARVGLTPDNRMVAGIKFTCVGRDGKVSANLSVGKYFISRLDSDLDHCGVFDLPGACRFGATADYSCPDESFVGIRLRFDTTVHGAGLLCDARSALAPPRPAGPPPVAAAPPGPPEKPIKSVSRGSAQTGPTSMASWLGNWTMITKRDGNFTLVMHDDADNGPRHMWGEFTGPDARLNGTLIGQLSENGRWFEFTYEQPASNASGSGKMMMLVNGATAATIKTNDEPPVEDTWRTVRP